MKFCLLALVLLSSQFASAKVETICGYLAFARLVTVPDFKERLSYDDYKVHEIRNDKDKIYYQILDGEELSDKFQGDDICITGEVVRGDITENLTVRDGSRPHKIKLRSFRDND